MSARAGRKGTYGIDAPYVPFGYFAGALIALVFGIVFLVTDGIGGALAPLIIAVVLVVLGGTYLHATRRGKFEIWSDALNDLALGGDERVLDLGCGRGAVLLAAARRLGPGGKAVGVDLWRGVDQSGNAAEVTERNAAAEGVADRVELHTADMTDLPFPDASFDVVVSSLAIHNIKAEAGRAQAIREAVRVLKPGGRLAIADITATSAYRRTLLEESMSGVTVRDQGWRGWWSGPWMPTKLVTATKPS
ncbi:class I SAM-dependent methyltransferase [Amycolatopsis anabasis]|uniref:class I SAM-dependent methyltransferase n=1 Tax=Amycolatopsis anabasis TaxID=1840409 RepID=UPI00131DA37C|nr:class I SAM-dependent methyltransferase [Amycolatopsis anabasis]